MKYVYIAKMKMNTTNVLIGLVIFGLIIMSLMASTVRVIPYNMADAFTKNFPYEGFEQMQSDLGYASASGAIVQDRLQSYALNSEQKGCKKVYGFDGLFCEPYLADTTLDIYSTATGSLACINKSSGLTNSKGSLCLDKNQKSMLMTRGGNSTDDSEIGK